MPGFLGFEGRREPLREEGKLIYHCTFHGCGWRAIVTGRLGRFTVTEMIGDEVAIVVNTREKLWFLWRAVNVAESWEDAHVNTNHNRNRPRPRVTYREY